jgi:hypothetical protein
MIICAGIKEEFLQVEKEVTEKIYNHMAKLKIKKSFNEIEGRTSDI